MNGWLYWRLSRLFLPIIYQSNPPWVKTTAYDAVPGTIYISWADDCLLLALTMFLPEKVTGDGRDGVCNTVNNLNTLRPDIIADIYVCTLYMVCMFYVHCKRYRFIYIYIHTHIYMYIYIYTYIDIYMQMIETTQFLLWCISSILLYQFRMIHNPNLMEFLCVCNCIIWPRMKYVAISKIFQSKW